MSADLIENNKNQKKPANCESCGKEFSCGADAGHCWCFEVKLSAQTLAEITKKYTNCLCPACLIDAERETLLAHKDSKL